MTKLEDVLHNYLGCEVQTPNGIAQLVYIGVLGSEVQKVGALKRGSSVTKGYKFDEIKPILKNISKIDKDAMESFQKEIRDEYKDDFNALEEKDEFSEEEEFVFIMTMSTQIINRLRKEGFDCDNLIKLGLAIEKDI